MIDLDFFSYGWGLRASDIFPVESIAVVAVAVGFHLQVLLVFFMSLIERSYRPQFGCDCEPYKGFDPFVLHQVLNLVNHHIGCFQLGLRVIKNDASVLGALVVALLIESSRVVKSEEESNKLFVRNYCVVEAEMEDFYVGGCTRAHFSILGIRNRIFFWTHKSDSLTKYSSRMLFTKDVNDVLFSAPIASSSKSSKLFAFLASHN